MKGEGGRYKDERNRVIDGIKERGREERKRVRVRKGERRRR